jgi:NhaA family Na+:H+ antiporter
MNLPAPDPTDAQRPPGSWAPAQRVAQVLTRSVERFLALEAASGLLLLAAAALALAWANSPWSASYFAVWHTPIGIRVGELSFERDLHFWINDGLMAVFFFVVGLEIRREIHDGVLSDLRAAALPLVAALGGMLVPALIYAAFNPSGPSARGWGIPMATDIAFAVGALTLLGERVPPALRILLLALAVIDDIGAILVIALFYSSGVQIAGLALVASGIALVFAQQAIGVRAPAAYMPAALIVWAGAYAGGLHPTLAGVALGVVTPVEVWLGRGRFAETARESAEAAAAASSASDLLPYLDALDRARREAVAPGQRLLHAFHPWVAFGVMPLFALANAGVVLSGASFGPEATAVFAGVALGLALGKPIGVIACCALAVRIGLARWPTGVDLAGVAVVGCAAGIGFTMALFVAGLALPADELLETAKLAILAASAAMAVLCVLIGRRVLPLRPVASRDREAT